MASSARAVAKMPMMAGRFTPAMPIAMPTSRMLSTISRATRSPAARPVAKSAATLKLARTGRIAFRRAYADEAPKPKPGKLRRTFRWAWRLTYLSVLGVLGYTGYVIYLDRNPAEQLERDPNKKTLVVLGTGWGSVALLKKLDTENYNVVVVSPRNYFLFTPLLPSCTTGTIEHRSIMEPVRAILRHKRGAVQFYEAEASSIDHERKVVKITDNSEIKGAVVENEIPYDMLVVGVGAENATFGIPGVRENSCFLKEIGDAQRIRKKIMDCVETAAFKDQKDAEINRLMHMVVVGGGPTGVEFAGELQDFFEEDIKKLVPEISPRFKVTLIEALPNVLPSFSKQLIDYTENTLREEKIDIKTKTMVKKVTSETVEAEVVKPDGTKERVVIPYGLLVWATGNAVRPIVKDLMSRIPAQKDSRRGLAVNEYLVVQGTRDIWAIGDCAVAGYAPTAQVAAQEGNFLGSLFNNMAKTESHENRIHELSSQMNLQAGGTPPAEAAQEIEALERRLKKIRDIKPFRYTHQGSMAYIGSEKAVADVSWWNGNFASGGSMTYLFWRSAYLSMCFSTRNRVLVVLDWLKSKAFGRDISRE
ncbi:External alternative NADH-ubiquinone oxidoreductase-like protein [Emericellopsis cladophorae]|uniref:NADH:ubiquinone reductase (non-electrogenic) n=1 Tax=Emericellopsis cladophorae TaxID=2686198 RepID=A0A9P9Y700_9HYPO|nr:External alternative NADH-ubiquinone oxidoreductase-like protein [Emericellopsis cladophorae]KAI6784753.1 External alternative NADH-ubiquinone oxidoreductase-like protein [Emericellopsis cladophorae]